MNVRRLLATTAVPTVAATIMLSGTPAGAASPGPSQAIEHLTKVPGATSGFLVETSVSWTAVPDPGSGVSTTGYAVALQQGDIQQVGTPLADATGTSGSLPFAVGNSFFGLASIGVAALFSDGSASTTTPFRVRPITKPMGIFRFRFPDDSADLALSPEFADESQFMVGVGTFLPQCGLSKPTTIGAVTVVGHQSTSERTSGLALARARAVADDINAWFDGAPSPPTVTIRADRTPARQLRIPARSATVFLTVSSTPSPSCS